MGKLLERYRDELRGWYFHGGYNPLWFALEYGVRRGKKVYRQKAKKLNDRMKFLKKRIKQLEK